MRSFDLLFCIRSLLSIWFNLLTWRCMPMIIVFMFSPLPISLELQPHFQLFHMYLYLDVHWFLKPPTSWSEPCFIAHKPVCCPFCYVNGDVIQQFLRFKYVTYSFASVVICYSVMKYILSILSSQHFSIKLCSLSIHKYPLIQTLTTCLLDYRNSFAINITLFSLIPSKSY